VELRNPHLRYHRSFLAALDEFAEAGETHYGRLPSWPPEGRFPGVDFSRDSLADPAGFQLLVDFLLQQRDPFAPRPRAYVPFTELWMVESTGGEPEYVGRISLRHELNEPLLVWGGHIGYVVRPSARRRGHATAALHAILPLCRERGIERVLVTCDVDNVPSRRVIEGAGGVYEDTREGKLRYWIATG